MERFDEAEHPRGRFGRFTSKPKARASGAASADLRAQAETRYTGFRLLFNGGSRIEHLDDRNRLSDPAPGVPAAVTYHEEGGPASIEHYRDGVMTSTIIPGSLSGAVAF